MASRNDIGLLWDNLTTDQKTSLINSLATVINLPGGSAIRCNTCGQSKYLYLDGRDSYARFVDHYQRRHTGNRGVPNLPPPALAYFGALAHDGAGPPVSVWNSGAATVLASQEVGLNLRRSSSGETEIRPRPSGLREWESNIRTCKETFLANNLYRGNEAELSNLGLYLYKNGEREELRCFYCEHKVPAAFEVTQLVSSRLRTRNLHEQACWLYNEIMTPGATPCFTGEQVT